MNIYWLLLNGSHRRRIAYQYNFVQNGEMRTITSNENPRLFVKEEFGEQQDTSLIQLNNKGHIIHVEVFDKKEWQETYKIPG